MTSEKEHVGGSKLMKMNGTMKTLVRKPDEIKKYNEGMDNQNS